jgi:hypothetical protein
MRVLARPCCVIWVSIDSPSSYCLCVGNSSSSSLVCCCVGTECFSSNSEPKVVKMARDVRAIPGC